jgi:hypothetical protein
MDLLKQTLENSIGIWAIEKTPISEIVNRDNSVLTRNLKRGFVYYLLNEGIEQLNTGHSNFNDMDVLKLVDDTAYLGVASIITEQTNIPSIVDNVIPSGYVSEDIKTAVVSGVVLTGFNYLGNTLHGSSFGYVRHIGSKIKDMINF